MPRTPSPADRAGDAQLSPEMTLIAAIVAQAWKDLRSPEPEVREEAQRWWHNAAALAFWEDVTGIPLRHYAP